MTESHRGDGPSGPRRIKAAQASSPPGVQRVGPSGPTGAVTKPAGQAATRSVQDARSAPARAPDAPSAAPDDEMARAARADDPSVAQTPPAEPTSEGLVKTGVSGLDAQFGGGLPQGNLVLVSSEPTTATHTLAGQYAAAGLDVDETVFYVSLEQDRRDVEKTIRRFVHDESKMGRLHIIDGSPLQFRDMTGDAKKRLGVRGGEDPLEALEELLVDDSLNAPVRFVIESYTELSNYYDDARILRTLRLMRAVVRHLPATALVTLVTPLHDKRTVASLQHIADGVIEFDLERKGFGLYPYISVTKMRGVAGSARLLVYKETRQGLWIESTKRVF